MSECARPLLSSIGGAPAEAGGIGVGPSEADMLQAVTSRLPLAARADRRWASDRRAQARALRTDLARRGPKCSRCHLPAGLPFGRPEAGRCGDSLAVASLATRDACASMTPCLYPYCPRYAVRVVSALLSRDALRLWAVKCSPGYMTSRNGKETYIQDEHRMRCALRRERTDYRYIQDILR